MDSIDVNEGVDRNINVDAGVNVVNNDYVKFAANIDIMGFLTLSYTRTLLVLFFVYVKQVLWPPPPWWGLGGMGLVTRGPRRGSSCKN